MYEFQPLGKNSIRLLQIQPELRNGHIACILDQFNDSTIPQYDALWYDSADPERAKKIYVNDALVDIHKSLWEFLDQMQRSQETKNWIWTESICLDQNSPEEMDQKLTRMGYLYMKAERTISWFGCNNSSSVSHPDGSSTAPKEVEEGFKPIAEGGKSK